MKDERFWMVWNPGGRAPSRRHASRNAADAEAKRLASANPGQRFFVLKAVGGVLAESPKISEIKLTKPSDEIPF